jgi:hypothetical protein
MSILEEVAMYCFIIAGVCLSILIIIGITLLVKKRNSNAVINYFNERDGLRDIQIIEKFLKDNYIPLPKPREEDNHKYFVSCLRHAINHCIYQLSNNLRIKGYSDDFILSSCGRIYYNLEETLVFTDIFKLAYLETTIKGGSVNYKYHDSTYKTKYLTLTETISLLNSLKEPNAYKKFSISIPTKDIFWYVKGGYNERYKVADAAAGAIVGGVLLGPAGAYLGMSSSTKNSKENDNKKVIILGGKIKTWEIPLSELNTLSKHFPNKRLPDKYDKSM